MVDLWTRVRRQGGRAASAALIATLFAFPAHAAECDVAQAMRALEGDVRLNAEDVLAFYDTRDGGGCAWDEEGAGALVSTLMAAGDHGLDPALFHADLLAEREGTEPVEGAERDVLLTDAALKYAIALTRGLSGERPSKADRAQGSRANGEIIDALIDAQMHGHVRDWLDGLAPTFEAYVRLQGALATYRAIAEAGGWPSVPEALTGKRRSRLIPLLKRRLAIEGDLSFDDGSTVFDEGLRAAVERFQARNGLRVNGKLTAKTIERLNVSASERVAQLSVNLERLRASGRDLAATRVEVNAPAATAILYRDGGVQLRMNAVVGAPGHDTPTLTSAIDTVILNPTWTVPQSIIQNEIKPAIKRDRKYLTKNHMYWAGEQLVQEAGPHNALGRVKFDFPNRYSVYLHDTPARKLFLDPERAQSHGCVRLEKPVELAVELLRDDPRWDRAAIEEAIEAGATRRIALSEAMPVVITYQTAFVDEEGLVNFRQDIYGLDTQLTLALSQRVAALRRGESSSLATASDGGF
jgi:murein L,D-transpeptidase YcbB/YkuD